MYKSIFKNDEIEFLCAEEDYGAIPAPYPAKKNIPEWFKALPPRLGDKGFQSSTVKRCAPFLDALSIGYIIPLAADIHFTVNSDLSGLDYKWTFYKTMIENHNMSQITTDKSPSPLLPRPPMKFMNYWMIKTPPEYSLLFMPPLNRIEPRFMCMSGIVDAPYYQYEYVNFPFVFNKPNFTGIIEAGTPLVQVIPIRKDFLLKNYRSRPFNEDDKNNTSWIRKMVNHVHESVYRNKIHRKL